MCPRYCFPEAVRTNIPDVHQRICTSLRNLTSTGECSHSVTRIFSYTKSPQRYPTTPIAHIPSWTSQHCPTLMADRTRPFHTQARKQHISQLTSHTGKWDLCPPECITQVSNCLLNLSKNSLTRHINPFHFRFHSLPFPCISVGVLCAVYQSIRETQYSAGC